MGTVDQARGMIRLPGRVESWICRNGTDWREPLDPRRRPGCIEADLDLIDAVFGSAMDEKRGTVIMAHSRCPDLLFCLDVCFFRFESCLAPTEYCRREDR